MKTPSNNDNYQIVITKPSKYKRSNEWIESSGELSPEEIEAIFHCDKIDSENKKEELYIIKGEIFELSGLDLITAGIDPKTLKFKK